jgi:MYXO-CTERM domain-containing protein
MLACMKSITTTTLFRAAVAVIALHVADDNFFHPEAGTSAGDHLLSGLVPIALLALAAWGYPRLRSGAQGALALFLGPLGIAAGVEAVHYAQTGPSGDDFTGFLTIPAGLVLLALGAATLWRSRRTDDRLAWRYPRRALIAVAALVVTFVTVFPIGFAYVVTHTARAVVPENRLGAASENVSFETSDGLTLRGWYVPSRNGAAVISFPGRQGPQKPAAMLARHGYGVLVFDRRGEGESDGEPDIFGWGGDTDVKAAVDFLQTRADVDRSRIGGIGLSVGGEMMLEAAAEDHELRAVVSEGAGARSFSDSMDEQDVTDMTPVDKALNAVGIAVRTGAMTVFTNQAPAANLKSLVGRIAPRPVMFIAAPNSNHGEELNRGF